jgi:hypothetical protein
MSKYLIALLVIIALIGTSQAMDEKSGKILSVDWGLGYNKLSLGGYDGNSIITIKNTGNTSAVFYIQVAIQSPSGSWDETGLKFLSTDLIKPGKKIKFEDIHITVHGKGCYNARITLYGDHFKNDKLDSKIQSDIFR